MRGKFLSDKLLFDPEITKTERNNRKKKKQATTITPGKSSYSNNLSSDKPLIKNNMVENIVLLIEKGG